MTFEALLEISVAIFLLFAWRITLYIADCSKASLSFGDSIAHLTYVREYRSKGKIDQSVKYLLDEDSYPTGYHKIVSKMPISSHALERFGGLLSILWDMFLVLILGLTLESVGVESLLALTFVPFCRLLFGNKSRSHHFSERAFGVLFGNIFLISAFMALELNVVGWIALAVLSMVVLSVSSKFALQATVFFSLGFSLAFWNLGYLSLLLASWLVAVLVTNGRAVVIAKGAIGHSLYYNSVLAKIVFRGPGVYEELFRSIQINIRQSVRLLFRNSISRVVIDLPLNVFVLWTVLQGDWSIWHSWWAIGIVLVFLISLGSLRFLGEPERYLEFSLLPVLVIVCDYDFPVWVVLVVVALFLFVLADSFYSLWKLRSVVNEGEEELIWLRKFMQEEVRQGVVLCAPLRLSFFLGYRFDGFSFPTMFSHLAGEKARTEYTWLVNEIYPFPRREISEVVTRFGVTHVVVDLLSTRSAFGGDNTYSGLGAFERIYQSDRFEVYSC